jgi:hypothetical protein
MVSLLRRVWVEEDGHAGPALLSVLAAIGAIALAVGAAEDMSWLIYLGGAGLAVGIFGFAIADHMTVDYDMYGRLEKLEGKSEE